ncbi:MAG: SprT-like domain-containing protein [Vicingaceae bacterium]
MRTELLKYSHYLPPGSFDVLIPICEGLDCSFKVRKKRQTKLGDYRPPQNGKIAQITVNEDLNNYHFLIIFIHELAHHFVWVKYGRKVQAHGAEWKEQFSALVERFYYSEIFPKDLQKVVKGLIDKPRASSFADMNLLKALREYDPIEKRITLLEELQYQDLFSLNNGKVFRKLEKRRSRILCAEVGSKRKYLIHKMAEVTPLEKPL